VKGTMVGGRSRVYQDLDAATDSTTSYDTAPFPPGYFHYAILVADVDPPISTTNLAKQLPSTTSIPSTYKAPPLPPQTTQTNPTTQLPPQHVVPSGPRSSARTHQFGANTSPNPPAYIITTPLPPSYHQSVTPQIQIQDHL